MTKWERSLQGPRPAQMTGRPVQPFRRQLQNTLSMRAPVLQLTGSQSRRQPAKWMRGRWQIQQRRRAAWAAARWTQAASWRSLWTLSPGVPALHAVCAAVVA